MIFREATIEDIGQIQVVRNSVKENPLSNPDLVTDKDCEVFMFQRGKGWVCEIDKLHRDWFVNLICRVKQTRRTTL